MMPLKFYITQLKKNDADVVKANYYRMYTDPKTNQPLKNTKVSEITKTTILDPHTDFTVFRLSPAIWSAIYKRTLLEQNQITFSSYTWRFLSGFRISV